MARRLRRNTRDGILAGVAAGFGDYFDIDPVLVRLAFIFLCFFGGTGFIIYLVAWVLMPRDVDLAGATAGAAAGAGAPPPAAGGTGEEPPPDGGAADDAAAAGGGAPEGGMAAAGAAANRLAKEAVEAGERVAENLRGSLPEGPGRGRLIGGFILIFLGAVFLADRFLPFHWWWVRDMWPLILVVIGVAMILSARRGD